MKIRTLSLVTCSVLNTIGMAASAQTAPVVTAEALPATADQTGIADIVVTAQKRSENLQRVPISITALTSEALEQRGTRGWQTCHPIQWSV